jgi:hypothetical protein
VTSVVVVKQGYVSSAESLTDGSANLTRADLMSLVVIVRGGGLTVGRHSLLKPLDDSPNIRIVRCRLVHLMLPLHCLILRRQIPAVGKWGLRT